jgi:hypothetical protein
MAVNTKLQTIPEKLATDAEAETILKDLELLVATTPTERDVFAWAYWPSIEQAESEDGQDEMATSGETLKHYLYTDMVYRLGEMLPDMAEDTQGTDEERRAKRHAKVAVEVAERITALLESKEQS